MTSKVKLVNVWVLTALGGASLGLLVDRSPTGALAATGLIALVGIAGQVIRLPLPLFFAGSMLLTSGLIDLPGRLHAGGFSANAGVTVLYFLLGLLILGVRTHVLARDAARPLRPLEGLIVYAVLSFGWGAPSIAAVQNVMVLFAFVVSMLCGIDIATREGNAESFASRFLGLSSLIALTLYGFSVGIGGFGGGAIVGSRSFGLFGLVVMAWGASGWRYGAPHSRTLTLLSGLLILLSLSRTAFAGALVIVCLAGFNPRTAIGWLRTIGAAGALVGMSYLATERIRIFHARTFTGDVKPIFGGLSINVSGRSHLWATTWHSYLTSPIFGHGAGSADTLITRLYSKAIGHPHNDYLRLLHDYGALGMCAWAIGFGWLLRRTWRSWRPSEHRVSEAPGWDKVGRIHAAAFLSLIGISLAMITDNVIDYLFVMGPVGVLVGLSLGLDRGGSGIETTPQSERRGARLWSATYGSLEHVRGAE